MIGWESNAEIVEIYGVWVQVFNQDKTLKTSYKAETLEKAKESIKEFEGLRYNISIPAVADNWPLSLESGIVGGEIDVIKSPQEEAKEYYEKKQAEKDYIEKNIPQELLQLEGIEVILNGKIFMIIGDTFQHKELLKAHGFLWNGSFWKKNA